MKKIVVNLIHYGCYDEDQAFTELTMQLLDKNGKDLSEPDEPVFSECMIISEPSEYITVHPFESKEGKLILPSLDVKQSIFDLIKQTLREARYFNPDVPYDWEITVCSHYDIWKPRFPFCEVMIQRAVFKNTSTKRLGINMDGKKYDVKKVFEFERNSDSKIFCPCVRPLPGENNNE